MNKNDQRVIKAVDELEKEKEISKDLLSEAIVRACFAYKNNYALPNVRVNLTEKPEISTYL